MADDVNKDAVRGWKRIFSIFNVSKDTPTALQPSPHRDLAAPISSGAFSKQELDYLPGFNARDVSHTKIKDLEKYFNHTSEHVANHTKAIQSFKALTPEIGKAKMVLVPSIMSPNDVQTDSLSIQVDCSDLTPDVNTELSKVMTEYFNKDLKLGTKVADWIGEALFETGAKPVLVLPKKPITLLANAMELEKELSKKGEVLGIGMEHIDVVNLVEDDVRISEEALFSQEAFSSDIEELIDMDVADAVTEEFGELAEVDTDISLEKIVKAAKINREKFNKSARDIFTFTTDYRSVLSAKETKNEKAKALEKEIRESLYGTGSGRLFISSDEGDIKEGDHPTLIPLPSEAVIPVSVPGSPSNHIGYFILTDAIGNPIETAPPSSKNGSTNTACNDSSLATGVQLIYGGEFNQKGLTKAQQFESASTVFGITIRKMLEKKLRDNNLEGITLDQHQAIMGTLFQRLIRKAKVRILFVPSTLVAYYAFEYRQDGTGKTILEDHAFLISLRNTMVVANVMSAIKNSTDRTRIEFNVGNQATNVEQLMEMFKEMYVNKRMLNFEHDPLTVARDLIQRSVTIVPKGLRGMEDLDVTTENIGGNVSTQPDTDMMDKLSELVTLSMNIPPSALNRLSEDEYSRSVATTNLFFANEIRIKQQVVTEVSTQLVRQYTQSSKQLIDKILSILKTTDKPADTEIDNKGETVTPDNLDEHTDTKLKEVEGILYKVINNMKVVLPTPTIAANKAQYEELREMMDTVDSLVNKLFDEESIGIDDNEAKEAYGAMRGFVRQTVMRQLASELGPHGAVDIPTLDNINPADISGFNQSIINLKRQLNEMKTNLDKSGKEGGGGNSWG